MRYILILCFILTALINTVNAGKQMLALRQLVEGSPVSSSRFANFERQMEEFEIPYEYVIGTHARVKVPHTARLEALNQDYLNMIKILRDSDYDNGLICEDDAYYHPNFPVELNKTINAAMASGGYDILDLCSQYLIGTPPPPHLPFGTLYYQRKMDNVPMDPTGRMFLEWPRFTHNDDGHGNHIMWPGGPVCLLVRNQARVLNQWEAKIRRLMHRPPDMILRDLVTEMPGLRMVAQPQLCREIELGKI